MVCNVPFPDIAIKRDQSARANLVSNRQPRCQRGIGALFEIGEHGRADLLNLLHGEVRLFELTNRSDQNACILADDTATRPLNDPSAPPPDPYRGPFTPGVVLDLSFGAATAIGMRSTQNVTMSRC